MSENTTTLSASPPLVPWIVDTVIRGVPLNRSPRLSSAIMYALSFSGRRSIASCQSILSVASSPWLTFRSCMLTVSASSKPLIRLKPFFILWLAPDADIYS